MARRLRPKLDRPLASARGDPAIRCLEMSWCVPNITVCPYKIHDTPLVHRHDEALARKGAAFPRALARLTSETAPSSIDRYRSTLALARSPRPRSVPERRNDRVTTTRVTTTRVTMTRVTMTRVTATATATAMGGGRAGSGRGARRGRRRGTRATAAMDGNASVETLLKPLTLDVDGAPMTTPMDVAATLAPIGALGLGYGVVRLGLHFRLQFATADALTRVTPRGAGLVIQLGADTKNLYYYPKDTKLVVCVDPNVSEDLVNRVGIETGIGVLPRSTAIAGKADGDLFWGQARESADAVVTTGALAELSPEEVKTVAKKAAAALKPGGRLIFIEPAGGERGQGLFDAIEATMAFESPIEFDDGWATLPLFPHAVGVAIKKETVEDSAEDSKRAGLRSRRRAK